MRVVPSGPAKESPNVPAIFVLAVCLPNPEPEPAGGRQKNVLPPAEARSDRR
jgi:hypothetical protein